MFCDAFGQVHFFFHIQVRKITLTEFDPEFDPLEEKFGKENCDNIEDEDGDTSSQNKISKQGGGVKRKFESENKEREKKFVTGRNIQSKCLLFI